MRMLYKHPGPHAIHGDMFDYCIVAENKVDFYLKNGWFMTTPEALSAGRDPGPNPYYEPEQIKVKVRSILDLTDDEKAEIQSKKDATIKALMEKFNINYYAARMLKK